MTEVKTKKLFDASDLAQHTGTMKYYRVPMFRTLLTDGAHFVMENGASWLVTDALVIMGHHKKVKNQPFVAIYATPDNDGGAIVKYTDGNEVDLYTQKYEYSDLPCEVVFFCYDDVLMLRSEY